MKKHHYSSHGDNEYLLKTSWQFGRDVLRYNALDKSIQLMYQPTEMNPNLRLMSEG